MSGVQGEGQRESTCARMLSQITCDILCGCEARHNKDGPSFGCVSLWYSLYGQKRKKISL